MFLFSFSLSGKPGVDGFCGAGGLFIFSNLKPIFLKKSFVASFASFSVCGTLRPNSVSTNFFSYFFSSPSVFTYNLTYLFFNLILILFMLK